MNLYIYKLKSTDIKKKAQLIMSKNQDEWILFNFHGNNN